MDNVSNISRSLSGAFAHRSGGGIGGGGLEIGAAIGPILFTGFDGSLCAAEIPILISGIADVDIPADDADAPAVDVDVSVAIAICVHLISGGNL